MTLWHTILIASIAVLAIKLLGYAVPPRLFERPRPRRTLELLTVSLLAALVAVQALGTGQALVMDARIPGVLAAGILFAFRVPFIVAVAAAALVAALCRSVLAWP